MAEAYGLPLEDLPDTSHPVAVICIVKSVDMVTGKACSSIHITEDLPVWEAAGLLRCWALDAEHQFLDEADDDPGMSA